jgi:hypothetical protein
MDTEIKLKGDKVINQIPSIKDKAPVSILMITFTEHLLKLALDKKGGIFLDQVVIWNHCKRMSAYDKDFSDSIYGIEKMVVM